MTAQNSTPASTASSLSRTRSVKGGASTPVSARSAVKKPGGVSSTTTRSNTPDTTAGAADEDAKAEMAAQLEDLREQLRQVEQREEESQKQNRLLQARLNDAVKEQGRLEEGVHEHMERIEELQNEKKESTRAHRELEGIYEAERAQVMKDKEETQAREEELTATIQRLKETLAQRDLRANLEDDKRPSLSRACSCCLPTVGRTSY